MKESERPTASGDEGGDSVVLLGLWRRVPFMRAVQIPKEELSSETAISDLLEIRLSFASTF